MQVHTFYRDHLCSELVSLSELSDDPSVRAIDGNLEEIGEWSALILTENALSPGTKVLVTGKAHEMKGFVKSCTFDRLLGYFLEIGFDEESRWSEKWFAPEHLTKLCPTMRYFTEAEPKVTEKLVLADSAHPVRVSAH